jgi:hypothetical protein
VGKSTVFANRQGISSRNSEAFTVSGPDVCLTPQGNVQVPVPYTNTAESSTLANGSRTVRVDGSMAAIDGCCYSTSKGDEAGSGKGVMSGHHMGKAEFVTCSTDVFIEGKGVCRNTDLMTQNSGSAMGMNRDSSGKHAQTEEQTAKTTFRLKVVEYHSWDNYDAKARQFNLDPEKNKPVANRKVKIRINGGTEVEKTTDDKGIIELTDQEPSAIFEVILEPENAKMNNKEYLFRGRSPLRKEP